MDLDALKKQLIIDEGKRLKVYKDNLGYLTVGIGHFVIPSDKLILGDQITEEQCDKFFEKDVEKAIKDCNKIYPGFNKYPENIQLALANMVFNMGGRTMLTFKNFNKFIKSKQWSIAADSLVKSLWYTQVGNRAKRIIKLIKSTQV